MSDAVLAVGLDLGSTRVKAATLDAEGVLGEVEAADAPALRGSDGVREGDADAYAAVAGRVLRAVSHDVKEDIPLGIATQRSTLVIWDRDSGTPRTPMVSWQDRRAADWCSRHRAIADEVVQRSGLPLSAHYAGPKLAAMQEADPSLRDALRSGSCLFGTLESYLTWSWSGRRAHETDLGVAARTQMVDLSTGEWSPDLLRHFDVPLSVLPAIRPTAGRSVSLDNGLSLAATVADQVRFPAGVRSAPRNSGPRTASSCAGCFGEALGRPAPCRCRSRP